MPHKMLVIGARQGSLGHEIAIRADTESVTAGLTDEDRILDVTEPNSIREVLNREVFQTVVVTTGINVGAPIGHYDYSTLLADSLQINVIGVMNVLDQWVQVIREIATPGDLSFVAISSNSAHIARRNSAAYCASKAALSMAIRCAARELEGRPLVYGYEFGLLRGTPMTASTEKRFGPSQTRIPGQPAGLSVADAAEAVCANLRSPWPGQNGSLLRLDGGEQ